MHCCLLRFYTVQFLTFNIVIWVILFELKTTIFNLRTHRAFMAFNVVKHENSI